MIVSLLNMQTFEIRSDVVCFRGGWCIFGLFCHAGGYNIGDTRYFVVIVGILPLTEFTYCVRFLECKIKVFA